jgi:hypothetical protein
LPQSLRYPSYLDITDGMLRKLAEKLGYPGRHGADGVAACVRVL